MVCGGGPAGIAAALAASRAGHRLGSSIFTLRSWHSQHPSIAPCLRLVLCKTKNCV
ncbi:MAG: hypothetical protein WCI51_00515 [Lentisphaerota bacterium]